MRFFFESLAVLIERGHGRRVAAAATGREAATAAAGHGVRAVLLVAEVEVAAVAAAVVVPVDAPEWTIISRDMH